MAGTIAADPMVRCISVVILTYRDLHLKQGCLGSANAKKASCLQNTATIFPEDPALVANEGRAFLERLHSADAKRLADNLKAKQKTAADRAAKDKTTASMFFLTCYAYKHDVVPGHFCSRAVMPSTC